MVVDEHDAIAGLAGTQVFKRIVHLGHGKRLGDGRARVPRTKLQHGTNSRRAAGR